MQWLADNWFLVLFGGGMIVMHLFGHGHGGGHGGHGKKLPKDAAKSEEKSETDTKNQG